MSSSHLILYPPLSSSKSTKMLWISLVLSSLLNPVSARTRVVFTACCPGRTPLVPGAEAGGTVPWPEYAIGGGTGSRWSSVLRKEMSESD